jgi:hypothetical protein
LPELLLGNAQIRWVELLAAPGRHDLVLPIFGIDKVKHGPEKAGNPNPQLQQLQSD